MKLTAKLLKRANPTMTSQELIEAFQKALSRGNDCVTFKVDSLANSKGNDPMAGRIQGLEGVVLSYGGKIFYYSGAHDRMKVQALPSLKDVVVRMGGGYPATHPWQWGVTLKPYKVFNGQTLSKEFLSSPQGEKAFSTLDRLDFNTQVIRILLQNTPDFELLGEGSSRVAFSTDDPDWVLKLALNRAGVAQNKVEAWVSAHFAHLPITQVAHQGLQGGYLIVQAAYAMDDQTFQKDFGMSFEDFTQLIVDCEGNGPAMNKWIKENKAQHPKMVKLLSDLLKAGLETFDLAGDEQWGEAGGHAKILDYGFTPEVADQHYQQRM